MAIQRRGTIGVPTDGYSSVFSVVFWIAFFAAGGYGVYWCVGYLKQKADSEVEKSAPQGSAAYKREVRKEAMSKPPAAAPAFVPAREAKPELDRAAAEVNLLVLAKEAARIREDSGQWMEYARSLAAARQRFQQQAAGESLIPEVLEGNDEVLGIEDVDFARLKPDEASRRISQAIARIPAGTFLKVRVRRGNPRDVILYFGASTGLGTALAQRGLVKISNQLAMELQKNVLTLPPDQLTEFERRQIERILGAGEATDEEYATLVGRLSGAKTEAGIGTAAKDQFTRQIQRLNSFLPKAPVPEAILMKDGRKFSGTLLQDTPGAVSIRTVVGDITVAREDVERVVNADEVRAEFKSKFSAGEKYRDAYLQLLVWTQELNMPVHRELVAYTILQTAPNEPFARNAAGYVQMDGQWQLKNSIAAGAPIPEKKVESREDIRRELESMGFVLRGNKWFSKVPWTTGIDSLYKPSSLKSNLNGTAIMDWHEQDTLIYRMDEKPRKLGPTNMKFIAPTGAQGLASILVEAPGEIVECQVRASGAVVEGKANTRLECFVTAEGGRSEILYDINKGGDASFHDVTKHTRGKQKFTVTARMITLQDKYHTYVRFLTSTKDASQVFWVKGVVLKPAGEFDRLWAAAK